MGLVCRSQFEKLWAINPVFTDPAHNYDNTRVLLTNLIKAGCVTADGKPLTVELITGRYRRYVQQRNILNEGVEPRFQKKIHQVEPLHQWLYKKLYDVPDTTGETGRNEYLWGGLTEDQLSAEFAKFLETCNR